MRVFDTVDSGLRARVYVREGSKAISVKEAEELLDPDTLNKLLKVGNPVAILSVRLIKEEERYNG